MKKIIFFLFVLISSFCAPFSLAKNLGVMGTVYPITEADFLVWIKAHMQEKIQSGEFARWQSQQIQDIKYSADRPEPVAGLTQTQQTRSWLYDPTMTLTHDLLDAEGQVRLPAGTRFNPLDQVTWTQTLLFYNADDLAQVAWAQQMNQQLQGHVLLILTQGSVSQQTHTMKQRIYFDQGGQLVRRFGITHIPASVSQAGKQLRVREIKL